MPNPTKMVAYILTSDLDLMQHTVPPMVLKETIDIHTLDHSANKNMRQVWVTR